MSINPKYRSHVFQSNELYNFFEMKELGLMKHWFRTFNNGFNFFDSYHCQEIK